MGAGGKGTRRTATEPRLEAAWTVPHGAEVSGNLKTGPTWWGVSFVVVLTSGLMVGCVDRGPGTYTHAWVGLGEGQVSGEIESRPGLGRLGAAGVERRPTEERAGGAKTALGCGATGTPFGLPLEVAMRADGGSPHELVGKARKGRRAARRIEEGPTSEGWRIEVKPRAGGERWLERVGPEVVVEVYVEGAQGARRERLVRVAAGFEYRWRPLSLEERVVLTWTGPNGQAGLRVEYGVPAMVEPGPRTDILKFETIATRGLVEEAIPLLAAGATAGGSGSALQGVEPGPKVYAAGQPPGERNE